MTERKTKDLISANIKSKQGTSLVIVICIAALLMSFALSMLYTASLLLSRANRRLEQERSYQLAQSFAQVLDSELKDERYVKPDESVPPDSFYYYACNFLDGRYGEYDPDHPDETIFHYTGGSSSAGEEYGSIMVRLYKEVNQDQDKDMSGIVPSGGADEILKGKIQRFNFTVEVIAEKDGVSYSYSTEYRQMVTYEVEFTIEGGARVYWNEAEQQWHQFSQDGAIYEDDGDIQYKYLPDKITECKFENSY